MATQVLTGPQAAELLGVQEQTLRAWRVQGRGPKYIRYGGPRGRVRYAPQDVDDWLAGQKFRSTSEEVAGRDGRGATGRRVTA